MSVNWKINRSIDIVDTSIRHHLGKLKDKNGYSFLRENSGNTPILRDYSIYGDRQKFGPGFEELLQINLRKLSESQTELSMMDPASNDNNALLSVLGEYLPSIQTQLIEDRAKTSQKIIDQIINGFQDDGMILLDDRSRKFFALDAQSTESSKEFIDLERLQELRNIRSKNFDLSKLVRLCEEVNENHKQKSYFSVAMLLRTILNHIPPIFGFSTFEQVISQYGGKSFKDHMKHLDNSLRNIADSYLHLPIRKKETLPNKTQVNFSADLDVLLAEIVRILK